MQSDTYPLIIRRALWEVSDSPYAFSDLLAAFDVMSDAFCQETDPECSCKDLLEWFLALDPRRQKTLMREINTQALGVSARMRCRSPF